MGGGNNDTKVKDEKLGEKSDEDELTPLPKKRKEKTKKILLFSKTRKRVLSTLRYSGFPEKSGKFSFSGIGSIERTLSYIA